MELTSPQNVGNATRKMKPLIILPVNAQYKKRHGTVARAVHWNLCKKYQMHYSDRNINHSQ